MNGNGYIGLFVGQIQASVCESSLAPTPNASVDETRVSVLAEPTQLDWFMGRGMRSVPVSTPSLAQDDSIRSAVLSAQLLVCVRADALAVSATRPRSLPRYSTLKRYAMSLYAYHVALREGL